MKWKKISMRHNINICEQVRIPDCPGGPERILEISGESYDPLLPCLQAAVPYMYEGLDDVQEK